MVLAGIQLTYLTVKNGHCHILYIKHHMSIFVYCFKNWREKKKQKIYVMLALLHNQGNCGP